MAMTMKPVTLRSHSLSLWYFIPLLNVLCLLALLQMYHEATLCNLLEVLLYHKSIIETISPPALTELVDYCCRKLSLLASGHITPLPRDSTLVSSTSPSPSPAMEIAQGALGRLKRIQSMQAKGSYKQSSKASLALMEEMNRSLEAFSQQISAKVSEAPAATLDRQSKELAFQTSIATVTIIRFLSDNFDRVPHAIITRYAS